MWQTIIIWIVITLCSLYIGRKYLRQWRSALKADKNSGCIESSCSCCSSVSSCSMTREIKPVEKNK